MEALRKPILVGMPLRGEWFCPNTLGSKVPSHGTNRLGTRYAYDFVQADWTRRGWRAYRGGLPCAFEQYEVLRGGMWQTVEGGVPKEGEHVRFSGKRGGADRFLDWLCNQTEALSVLPRTHIS